MSEEIYNGSFNVTANGQTEDQGSSTGRTLNDEIFDLINTGHHLPDVITYYGLANKWEFSKIQEEINKCNPEEPGKFCKEQGLVSSDLQEKFVNYIKKYTPVDSVMKLGFIDAGLVYGDFYSWVDACKYDKIADILEALGSTSIVKGTTEDLSSFNDLNAIVTVEGTEKVTAPAVVEGKSVTANNLEVESTTADFNAVSSVELNGFSITGAVKTSAGTQVSINYK